MSDTGFCQVVTFGHVQPGHPGGGMPARTPGGIPTRRLWSDWHRIDTTPP